MLNITALAKKYGLSRTTLLYYERQHLLEAAYRSTNGYRWYGNKEQQRLEKIIALRSFGMSIKQIGQQLKQSGKLVEHQILDGVLSQHFQSLEQQVQTLRSQQKAILLLLDKANSLENNTVSKADWVAVMQAAGLSEQDMNDWHKQFESMQPKQHQRFLELLGIGANDIATIRKK
ncbi:MULTISPECIES: MerR family transcriptional regulator [unclassified Agarivorans]|uniref:MerR family transcriptional regulator n=1 Tax=unclassified Agarivorans TaxID=2636026 RepID=UPI0026E11BA1|nr:MULTISPECIES: MerR family transcriptional regulator [unclassified Agarivorans]MDO6683906.1 MerR family transcriptional regulator [Agarivorans sp. 3_MG-2023]MDO6714361.1 MerR family transcriptional regulator [Agarivorans sp. 2_MG-2023]